MSSEVMEFPATFDEFVEQYKIVDRKEVYTNGAELIPVFRVRQWLERVHPNTEEKQIEEMAQVIDATIERYYKSGYEADGDTIAPDLYAAGYRKQVEGKWLFEFTINGDYFYECSVCGRQAVLNGLCDVRNPAISHPYCHCGAKMKGG
jgi:hypothetical protein